MQLTHPTQLYLQATRKVNEHGIPAEQQSVQHERRQSDIQKRSQAVVFSAVLVLANVVGGTLLLAGMFLLPQIIAGLLGR